jgi:hypothetical protein
MDNYDVVVSSRYIEDAVLINYFEDRRLGKSKTGW